MGLSDIVPALGRRRPRRGWSSSLLADVKICLTCEGVTADATDRCVHCGRPLLDATTVHFPERRGDGDARNPMVGRVIDGKYRVLGVLGRGGMGTVYRAVHEVSLVHVALKVLHPRFAAHADFRAWFLAEARKAGRVVHENSARVSDVGVAHDGMVYIAVEFVDGVTLQEWLAGRSASPAHVVLLLEQIARALAAAHHAGVVHRDLSPRNVMVTVSDGRPRAKILDFGIAVAPTRSGDNPEDGHGAPLGFANPPYSAPEHLEGAAVDGRADLYSLGVIAYEALTGDLPVGGGTGRELVSATLEGRIALLRRRSGLPRSLARLVNELLARSPEQRPSTADEVADRLALLLLPRRRGLAITAITTLVASTAAIAFAYAPSSAPDAYLRARGGERRLVLHEDAVPESAQSLRSADFLDTRFDGEGFRLEDLRVELVRDGVLTEAFPLAPVLRRTGSVLRFGAQGSALTDRLAELGRDSSIELRFVEPGRAPLGYARVRLDDGPPVASLTVGGSGGARSVLRGDDRIEVRAWDRVDLDVVRLELSLGQEGGRGGQTLAVEIRGPGIVATARELIGGVLPGCRRHGPVRLRAWAADRAANLGSSEVASFADVDLCAPDIVGVAGFGGGRVVVQELSGSPLRVSLSESEPDLVLLVRRPGEGGFAEVNDVRAVGDRLDVRLERRVGTGEEPSGRWGFRVRDHAGNLGGVYEEDLEFRTAEPALELSGLDAQDGETLDVVRLGDTLISSGVPLSLGLRCNSIYRPERVELSAPGGEPAEGSVSLIDAGPGTARLEFGALAPGSYLIGLSLLAASTEQTVDPPPWRLTVLPPRVTLRLPDVSDVRFLTGQEERSMFRVVDGRLQQGAGWRLDPPDTRLVRGRIWTSTGRRLAPLEPFVAERAEDPLLVDAPLGRGWHVVVLAARDVLGREIEVLRGDAPAPEAVLPDGARGQEIARFFRHDRPVDQLGSFAYLEFGQPLRFELRSVLPAPDTGQVRLRVAGAEFDPGRFLAEPEGGRLSFALPFERVVVAADLASIDQAAFAEGREAELPAQILSPAGEFPLALRVRTIRSTLRAVEVGTLTARRLPEAVATMRFVPVPGLPRGGVWADPVPSALAGRRSIRTAPELAVRRVDDFFVQDRETTLGQYAAIVREGLGRAAEMDAEAARAALVHAEDPLGGMRLTEAAMVPTAHVGAAAELLEAAGSAPDRPVSGVDAFQAHTAIALLGLLVADDPMLFRLPTGVELEMAALPGEGSSDRVAVLNGASRRGAGLDLRHLWTLRQGVGEFEFGSWPLSAAQLEASGDRVVTDLGDEVTGLDTGLREWVLDLPFLPAHSDSRVLLEEWLADHARHVERGLEFAAHGPTDGTPDDLAAFVAVYGVVRGTPARGIVLPALGGPAPADWPGVVRVLQVRRDGEGLVPGREDRNLVDCGFRVAGGARFVQEVRSRW